MYLMVDVWTMASPEILKLDRCFKGTAETVCLLYMSEIRTAVFTLLLVRMQISFMLLLAK